MNTIATDHRTPDGKSPTSIVLLRNPLDFIAEDHLRLRTMCAEMDRLSERSEIEPAAMSSLLEYLDQELPLLQADEEDELIPRVLARAEAEDDLPKLVERLQKEHAIIAKHQSAVISGLADLAPDQAIPKRACTALRELAKAARRHLILENAVLLPLARARLTEDDLHSLRAAMLKRRGLEGLFAD